MKLYELISVIDYIEFKGDTIINVKGIAIDSKKVKKSDIFVCIEGTRVDSHRYISQAIARGAVAIVCSKDIESSVPIIKVTDTREAYARLCTRFFDTPSSKLKIISITGTNGKTTITYILKAIFEQARYKCGIIGTNGTIYSDKVLPATLTTPDSYELNKILADMVDCGVEYVFMEASAHAIALKKLCGIKSEIGVFTNISQDHLDFFKSMENYAATKISYFQSEYMKMAVVNADDDKYPIISRKCKMPIITYGLNSPADIFAINYHIVKGGCKYIVNVFDDILDITTTLYGEHNVYNAISAMAVAKLSGIDNESIIRALYQIKEINGRFNVIQDCGRFIVIDFAHSPDSLSNLLTSARMLTNGRLICVFGCGGDRDKSKRPIMGIIVGNLSDYAIITSDNPRYEEQDDITEDIVSGIISTDCEYNCINDRADAIAHAIAISVAEDIIVIAGKGAETYIEIKGEKTPYSDKQTVINAL